MTEDTGPVRTTEQLDWVRLAAWLRERLPSCGVEGLDLSLPMLRHCSFPVVAGDLRALPFASSSLATSNVAPARDGQRYFWRGQEDRNGDGQRDRGAPRPEGNACA